jgi:hypothetical protein
VFLIVRCEESLPQRVIKQLGIRFILIHLFPAGERFLPCGGSDLTLRAVAVEWSERSTKHQYTKERESKKN